MTSLSFRAARGRVLPEDVFPLAGGRDDRIDEDTADSRRSIFGIDLPSSKPGVVNINLTRALAGSGFHYAPDPSSQGSLHDRRATLPRIAGAPTL